MLLQLAEKYTFRSTGSTTTALVPILHHTTVILKNNSYVTLVSLDFPKAFDSVKHSTLVQKLSQTGIHDNT